MQDDHPPSFVFGLLGVLFWALYAVMHIREPVAGIVWVAISAIPWLGPAVVKVFSRAAAASRGFESLTSHFRFSSLVFAFTLVFADAIRGLYEQPLPPITSSVLVPVGVCTLLFFISLAFMMVKHADGVDTIAAKLDQIRHKSGMTDWEKFLDLVESSGGNVLTVTGNLLSLRTARGTALLRQFLEREEGNSVKLVVPESAMAGIEAIQEGLGDDKLFSRVKIVVYKPFWFVQGMVIVGRVNQEFDYDMTPLGCFYYRIRGSEADSMAEDGVFVPINGDAAGQEYSEAIRAQFFLLDRLAYSRAPYSVSQKYTHSQQEYDPCIVSEPLGGLG